MFGSSIVYFQTFFKFLRFHIFSIFIKKTKAYWQYNVFIQQIYMGNLINIKCCSQDHMFQPQLIYSKLQIAETRPDSFFLMKQNSLLKISIYGPRDSVDICKLVSNKELEEIFCKVLQRQQDEGIVNKTIIQRQNDKNLEQMKRTESEIKKQNIYQKEEQKQKKEQIKNEYIGNEIKTKQSQSRIYNIKLLNNQIKNQQSTNLKKIDSQLKQFQNQQSKQNIIPQLTKIINSTQPSSPIPNNTFFQPKSILPQSQNFQKTNQNPSIKIFLSQNKKQSK